MTTDTPETVERPASPPLSSSDLLGRIVAELKARRGSAESEAISARRCREPQTEREWQARAAGIAEASAVVQMFMRHNTEVSSGAKTKMYEH
jgi:hypothetical protein